MSINEALQKAGLSYQRTDGGKPQPTRVIGKTAEQQWNNATILVKPLKKN